MQFKLRFYTHIYLPYTLLLPVKNLPYNILYIVDCSLSKIPLSLSFLC